MERVIEALKQLINTSTEVVGSPLADVKTIYWGDPIQIPESNLPAIAIQPVTTQYNKRGSKYDRKTHVVDVVLIDNVKRYSATTPSDVTKVTMVEQFIKSTEEVGQDGKTSTNSIVGIVASNPRLPYTDPDDASSQQASIYAEVDTVNYVFNTARGFPTFEVITTVEAWVQGDRS